MGYKVKGIDGFGVEGLVDVNVGEELGDGIVS